MPVALRITIAAALVACSPLRSPRPISPQQLSCASIQNVDAVLARGTVTLFGELHGTQQSPAFVGSVLCNAAARRVPATLALELSNESTSSLERYIRSNGTPADRDALFANEVWHEPPDGRTSAAMLALLDTARILVHSGADVDVLAFSHPSSLGDQMRDSLMAVTLAESAAAHPQRVIIGLTGNVHSQPTLGTSRNPTFRPMTYLLRGMLTGRHVIGLNVTYDSGTAWLCLTGSSCGAHGLRGQMRVPLHSIEFGSFDAKYDGLYGVGALSASPPAIQIKTSRRSAERGVADHEVELHR